MKKYKELHYKELRKMYNPEDFVFPSTEKVTPIDGIIGQNRAAKAMEFGLHVKNSKYNLFVVGPKGTGKKSYVKNIVKENAKKEQIPNDWCYVYNFLDPSRPKAINMPSGKGKAFHEDMQGMVEDLLEKFPKAFGDEVYEKAKTQIVKSYQDERNELFDQLTEYCKEEGFSIKNTARGFALAPIIDEKVLTDEEYQGLENDLKDEIEKKAENVELKAMELIRKIKNVEQKAKKRLEKLDRQLGEATLEPIFESLMGKYEKERKIIEYLKEVKKDMMEHLYDFDPSEDQEDPIDNELFKRYKVNLFIDHSEDKGAPVVFEYNPTYQNLVGKIEYENEQGSLKTDFTMIRPGAIHKANGGYLILQANQILSQLKSWDALKCVIDNGKLLIESLRSQLGIVDIASLKPEEIPISMKVIMIGNPYLYHLLYQYDEDFEKLFKVKVDFDNEMNDSEQHQMQTVQFISSFCEKEGLRQVDAKGVAKVLEYSHRLAGSQKKLTTKFNQLTEILIEADAWARSDEKEWITEKEIKKAFVERIYRNNKIEQKLDEMYRNGKILFDCTGKAIGKIHGLAVLDTGDYMFGKPALITVTTYAGNKGVINIEREAKMSGKIHDKGIMILEGYLCEKFAQEKPLSLTSKICFEQNYGGIDGDSASSTELYALLSSLSDIPLKQHIAVTGSVNQKGMIQPVGGVTQKIEGFFSLCKYFGLAGNEGVIIPKQNQEDLVLNDEVVEAVKKGMFHIYPVGTIEEGMEILTDRKFTHICERVKTKLHQYEGANKSFKRHKSMFSKRMDNEI